MVEGGLSGMGGQGWERWSRGGCQEMVEGRLSRMGDG